MLISPVNDKCQTHKKWFPSLMHLICYDILSPSLKNCVKIVWPSSHMIFMWNMCILEPASMYIMMLQHVTATKLKRQFNDILNPIELIQVDFHSL